MAQKRGGISGDWFGVMVHQPNVALMAVTFIQESESTFRGTWSFPFSRRAPGAKGAFTAQRFAEFLSVVIKSRPLANVQCQMTILEEKGESMITGVVPIPGADVPFLTVTLFRRGLEVVQDGICPIVPGPKHVKP